MNVESGVPSFMRSRRFLVTWLRICQGALWLGLCVGFFVLCFIVWYFFVADLSSVSDVPADSPPSWVDKAEAVGLVLVGNVAVIWSLRTIRRALRKLKAGQAD